VNAVAFVALRTAMHAPPYTDLREIAVLRAEPGDAAASDVYAARVRSLRSPEASDASAIWLVDAMDHVRELTRGCALAAFDVDAVDADLQRLCDDWELLPLELTPVRLDLGSLAWPLLVAGDTASLHFTDVCAALDVPVPSSEQALEHACTQAEIYRRLMACLAPSPALRGFNHDERAIVDTIIGRLGGGRRTYGSWRVDDGRNNPKEALAEVMDALNYCAAELVRLAKGAER
jgi:hypothetical protein